MKKFKMQNEKCKIQDSRSNIKNEKGVALIITLLVVTLLTALIVEFAYSARVNLSAAGNFRDKQKAYYLAKSGVNFIGGMLKDNASKSPPKADDLNQMLPPVTVGDGVVTLKAFDESAKINMKTIKNNKKTEDMLRRLFEILNINSSLPDAIKEREGEYNLLSELRLVSGMTDDVYDKIKNYLTVYGDGTGKININTADAIVLQCLSPYIKEGTAQSITSYREKNRFKNDNIKDLENIIGTTIYNDIKNVIVVESNHYSVISTGTVNEVDNTIEVVLQRKSKNEVVRLYWRSL